MSLSPRLRALTIVVPALAVALGCAAKPTPVGKWNGTVPNIGQATVELKPDGTLAESAATAMGQVQVAGNYKVEGEKLSITITDIQTNGKSVMAMVPPQLKEKLSETVNWKVEGDTLTMTDTKGQSQSLTRVKE